jgi:tetratricopeptide (TPR) repeat protein
MRKRRSWYVLVPMTIVATLLTVVAGFGQSAILDLPRQSQRALVTQRVGITDITISYHRPLVGGRKIWDAVVPYGQVWRAGANENTTIEFSDPVSIEGQALDKGKYGLHMIPGADQWTVIFSKNSTSWGSFTYEPKEDALRVNVKPAQAEFHEALTYDFDQPKPDSVVATLKWEKIAVPFNVSLRVNDIVESSLQNQLRGLAQYTWFGWNDAANYLLDHKTNLEEALHYTDRSIQNEERFDNLITKSKILTAMGRKDEATVAHDKAFAKASPLEKHLYGRQLQAENHQDEAFSIFRDNAKNHPNEWFVHSGLARIYCAQGDFANAAKEMKVALAGAPDQQKTYVEGLVKRLEAKQDINK